MIKRRLMNAKVICTILVFLFIATALSISNAQSIKFGIKGGLNSSGINPLTPYETKWKTGFNVYVFADFLNFRILSISGETGYTQKGFEAPFALYNEKIEYQGIGKAKAKLEYLDISVLVKLKIPGSMIIPYLLAGPSFGFKLRDNVSSPELNDYSDLNGLQFLLMDFSSITFGMKAGVGSELNIVSNISFVLEARYNVDLSVSYETPDLTVGTISWGNNSNNLRNHVFEFMAGVKF